MMRPSPSSGAASAIRSMMSNAPCSSSYPSLCTQLPRERALELDASAAANAVAVAVGGTAQAQPRPADSCALPSFPAKCASHVHSASRHRASREYLRPAQVFAPVFAPVFARGALIHGPATYGHAPALRDAGRRALALRSATRAGTEGKQLGDGGKAGHTDGARLSRGNGERAGKMCVRGPSVGRTPAIVTTPPPTISVCGAGGARVGMGWAGHLSS
eukprot:3844862-Prymnesium_polylepis.3